MGNTVLRDEDDKRARHAAWKREWRKNNEPPTPVGYVGRGHPAPPISEKLLAHREVDPATGCWNWARHVGRDGYGHIGIGGTRSKRTHVAAYECFVGPVPEGLQLDHLCRNRRCFNPAHLEPVTPRENTRRGLIARGKLSSTANTDETSDIHTK